MARRIVGTIFCFLSILLYVLPSILAAIIASGKGIDTYLTSLEYISFKPLAVITLIVGLLYLIYSEISFYYINTLKEQNRKK